MKYRFCVVSILNFANQTPLLILNYECTHFITRSIFEATIAAYKFTDVYREPIP